MLFFEAFYKNIDLKTVPSHIEIKSHRKTKIFPERTITLLKRTLHNSNQILFKQAVFLKELLMIVHSNSTVFTTTNVCLLKKIFIEHKALHPVLHWQIFLRINMRTHMKQGIVVTEEMNLMKEIVNTLLIVIQK